MWKGESVGAKEYGCATGVRRRRCNSVFENWCVYIMYFAHIYDQFSMCRWYARILDFDSAVLRKNHSQRGMIEYTCACVLMYVCVYVGMSTCMHVCMCVSLWVGMYAYMYVCVCGLNICVRVCMCIHIHVCVCVHVCAHTCTCVHMPARIQIYINI